MKLTETNNWIGSRIENGILKNVKILGSVSKNGNLYPRETREKAHKLFEGIHVNLNHLTDVGADNMVEKKLGKLTNIHEKDDGSYADFHFLTAHPFAPALVEAAERMPELYGFSIHGGGRGKKKDGKYVVESIDTLQSIDLVAYAGTTISLFESEKNMEEETKKSCEDILGELIAALVADNKEEFVKDAIKLKKKIVGDADEEQPDEVPADEAPAEESWKRDYKKLKLEKDCRELLESKNLPIETPLLETLTALPDEEAREKFLAWHKRKSIVKQTRSSDVITLTEAQKDYAKLLRGK